MSTVITEEFKATISTLLAGKNVLITGRAGTGKSTLLNHFIKQHLHNRNCLITAPTGVAALNIEGSTIHKAFGLRPGQYPDDVSSENYHISTRVKNTLKALDVLVVDEISMVRADLFDMMDIILRRVRKTDTPFGGIQLILVGDLLQLPPVVPDQELELFKTRWKSPYFFSAECYRHLQLESIELSHIWRQKDKIFIELLNQVREGEVHPELLSLLNSKVTGNFTYDDEWVTLTPLRKMAEKINNEQLSRVDAPEFESVAEVQGEIQDRQFPGTDVFQYKVGARVMSVKNHSDGYYVNGSFGTISAASEKEITVFFDNGHVANIQKHTWEFRRPAITNGRLSSETTGSITQFPLILAWAITIHKSQGKTIPKCQIALEGGTRADGQFYVALSRAVSLDNLRLSKPVTPRNIRANGQIVRMIRRNSVPNQPIQKYVVISFEAVDFSISQHVAHIHCTILENGEVTADFGSWINPNSDYGALGDKYSIPAFGLAPAPTLGDFWPLLRRQAAGGIIIGDNLSTLERAIRHQEPGLDVNLGDGYDAFELDFLPIGDTPEQRCHSITHALKTGTLTVERGRPAPAANQSDEGALFIPQWAPTESTKLDLANATDSDIAWSAMSFGSVNPQSTAEVQECVDLLASWADSRDGWNTQWREEIASRARRITNAAIAVPEVTDSTSSVRNILTPGTRIAFTGSILINGSVYRDDAKRQQLCESAGLTYKKNVSKTACDVLVAGDPSSMSRKAQAARSFNKPIVACEDFEEWYNNQVLGVVLQLPADQQLSNTAEETASVENAAVPDASEIEAVAMPATPIPTITFTKAADVLEDGSRVAFTGAVRINNSGITRGHKLKELCADLGLVHKDSVSRTRCDALVIHPASINTRKVELATSYGIPLVSLENFDEWATTKLQDTTAYELEDTHTEASAPNSYAFEITEGFYDIPLEQQQFAPDEITVEAENNTELPVLAAAHTLPTPEPTVTTQSPQEESVSVTHDNGETLPSSPIDSVVAAIVPSGGDSFAEELDQPPSPATLSESDTELIHTLFGQDTIAAPLTDQQGTAAANEVFIDGQAAWTCLNQGEFLDRISEGRNPFGVKQLKAGTSFIKFILLFPAWFLITLICGLIMQVHETTGGVIFSVLTIAGFFYAIFCFAQWLVRLMRGPRWNVTKSINKIESQIQSSIDRRFAVLFLNKQNLTPLHQQVLQRMEALYAESAFHNAPLPPEQWRELTIAALQAVDAYHIGNKVPAHNLGQRIATLRAEYQ